MSLALMAEPRPKRARLTKGQIKALKAQIDNLLELQIDAAFAGSLMPDEADEVRAIRDAAVKKLMKYIDKLGKP